jgi:uncharacterized membrane protein YidH (DUF202 family)
VIGVGFALYGVALIVYGTARARQLEAALARGASIPDHGLVLSVLTVVGASLAVVTAVLIAFA